MAQRGEAEEFEAVGAKVIELIAQPRLEDEIGKRPSRRLRRAGYVPAVVYGASVGSIPIKLKAIDVKRAFGGLPHVGAEVMLKLQMHEGEKALRCLVKEFQVDPLSLQLLSVDFHAVE